jgi:hypothetical protein
MHLTPRIAGRFALAFLPVLLFFVSIRDWLSNWRTRELLALSLISPGALYDQFTYYYRSCKFSTQPFCMPSPRATGLEFPDAQLHQGVGWTTELTHLISAYWWVGTFAFRTTAQTGVLFLIAALIGIALVAALLRKGTWYLAVIFPLALPIVGIAVLWLILKLLWFVVFVVVSVLIFSIPWVSGVQRGFLETVEMISASVKGTRESAQIIKEMKTK